ESSVAGLVAFQAATRPDATAVASSRGVLSYSELDSRANEVARALGGLGVCPETVIGLLLPRSPAMVVGALGILKSGGAYLPLDPRYPAGRLAFMLRDAQARVVVTALGVKAQVPSGLHEMIILDELGRVIESPPLPPVTPSQVTASPKSLA